MRRAISMQSKPNSGKRGTPAENGDGQAEHRSRGETGWTLDEGDGWMFQDPTVSSLSYSFISFFSRYASRTRSRNVLIAPLPADRCCPQAIAAVEGSARW
jgi:hypothetical protein